MVQSKYTIKSPTRILTTLIHRKCTKVKNLVEKQKPKSISVTADKMKNKEKINEAGPKKPGKISYATKTQEESTKCIKLHTKNSQAVDPFRTPTSAKSFLSLFSTSSSRSLNRLTNVKDNRTFL